MISQERFDELEMEYGCGYWNVCCDHACPCAITVEHKGLQESIWNTCIQEGKEMVEELNGMDDYGFNEYDDDFYYEDESDDEEDYDYPQDLYCDGCGNADQREFIHIENDLYKCPKCGQLYTLVDGEYRVLDGVFIN